MIAATRFFVRFSVERSALSKRSDSVETHASALVLVFPLQREPALQGFNLDRRCAECLLEVQRVPRSKRPRRIAVLVNAFEEYECCTCGPSVLEWLDRLFCQYFANWAPLVVCSTRSVFRAARDPAFGVAVPPG